MKTTTAILLAASLGFATSAGATFRCVDEKGVTRIGETPPDECAKVLMYEISRNGSVIKTIEPSLTPEQVKARAEAEEKKKEADRAANEQKRKDLALLATYSSEAEFDVVRDRTIEPITGRIKSAQERLEAIDKRTTELEGEMEFYKAGKSSKASAKKAQAPVMLTSELERLKNEKVTLAKGITASEKEIKDMRAKFDIDKKRWLALKSGSGSRIEEPVAEAKAEAKPEPKAKPVRK
jgi:hypothetical protein